MYACRVAKLYRSKTNGSREDYLRVTNFCIVLYYCITHGNRVVAN